MTPWGRATLALRLLALDPAGLGGIAIHARVGPVRDAFVALLPANVTRLHPAMGQEALTGGIDVTASLADGTIVRQKGVLETDSPALLLPMAERTPPLMATALCTALDGGSTTLIALDEHTEDEGPPPAGLMDRLAFHISLEGVSLHDLRSEPKATSRASQMPDVAITDQNITDITAIAVTLGISSLRAPTLALNAARAHAALNQRENLSEEDMQAAAELVLAPRATRMPEEAPPPPPEAPEDTPDSTIDPTVTDTIPDELLLAAIATALPPDLLNKAGSSTAKNGQGSGAGKKRIGNRRGRPLPAREGGGKSTQPKVDIVATLRAAIPWQKLRRQMSPQGQNRPIIHPSDLRYRRYEDLSDRLLIFAVDASGSAALARLAEAKGAVELLLAEAYARRDHVSLIAFRGKDADVLLPPTRSLVQTKRRLADLPGGGATPLASGLSVALETALHATRRGMDPVIVLLTDGRGNIALSGAPDRTEAASDAQKIARQIATDGVETIVIDTSRRPERALKDLAASLRGHYASLPRADAQRLSQTVSTALES